MIAVDTSALFAILNTEPDARLMSESLLAVDRRFLSAATMVELGSLCAMRGGPKGLEAMDRLLDELEITVVSFDRAMAAIATLAYRRYGKGSRSPAKLNLGDCFSYALAKSLDAPLLFKGDDFIHTDIRSALNA